VEGYPRLKVRGSRALRLVSRPCALRPWNIIRLPCALRVMRALRALRTTTLRLAPCLKNKNPRPEGRGEVAAHLGREGAAGNSSVLLWQWTWQGQILCKACTRYTGRGGQPLWTLDKALRFACLAGRGPQLRETCADLLPNA